MGSFFTKNIPGYESYSWKKVYNKNKSKNTIYVKINGKELYENSIKQGFVKIGGQTFRISKAIRKYKVQCQICWKFHSTLLCRAKNKTCYFCAQPKLENHECKTTIPKCSNCKMNHVATSVKCSLRNRTIKEDKVLNNLANRLLKENYVSKTRSKR